MMEKKAASFLLLTLYGGFICEVSRCLKVRVTLTEHNKLNSKLHEGGAGQAQNGCCCVISHVKNVEIGLLGQW